MGEESSARSFTVWRMDSPNGESIRWCREISRNPNPTRARAFSPREIDFRRGLRPGEQVVSENFPLREGNVGRFSGKPRREPLDGLGSYQVKFSEGFPCC